MDCHFKADDCWLTTEIGDAAKACLFIMRFIRFDRRQLNYVHAISKKHCPGVSHKHLKTRPVGAVSPLSGLKDAVSLWRGLQGFLTLKAVWPEALAAPRRINSEEKGRVTDAPWRENPLNLSRETRASWWGLVWCSSGSWLRWTPRCRSTGSAQIQVFP